MEVVKKKIKTKTSVKQKKCARIGKYVCWWEYKDHWMWYSSTNMPRCSVRNRESRLKFVNFDTMRNVRHFAKMMRNKFLYFLIIRNKYLCIFNTEIRRYYILNCFNSFWSLINEYQKLQLKKCFLFFQLEMSDSYSLHFIKEIFIAVDLFFLKFKIFMIFSNYFFASSKCFIISLVI